MIKKMNKINEKIITGLVKGKKRCKNILKESKGAVSWEYIALVIIVLVIVGALITFLKPMLTDTVLPKLQTTIMDLFNM